jgi:Mg2+/Co2+ transporter CorB
MVYDGDPGNIVGVLQRRRLLAKAFEEDVTHEDIREQLVEPYFLPEATPIYSQLQFFRDNRQKFGLVVDEYGEIEGLVTLEDIIEEIIGKFTTGVPDSSRSLGWSGVGDALIDGMAMLRDINRQLAIELPLDGPRTLNGLILEHLQDIPESGVSLRIAGVPMEIVQTQDRKIKTVRLQRPDAL